MAQLNKACPVSHADLLDSPIAQAHIPAPLIEALQHSQRRNAGIDSHSPDSEKTGEETRRQDYGKPSRHYGQPTIAGESGNVGSV
jgi:hypothetical protein